MSTFRTSLTQDKASFQISHQDKICLVGSCFAEHIGERLKKYKFNTLLNPFGILYNPISIELGISRLMNKELYTDKNLFLNHGLWHNFDHHSQFSKTTKEETLEGMNHKLLKANDFLIRANRLIITFGTAFVFVHKKSNKIVANCHKIPNAEFERRRLSIDEITEALFPLFEKLKKQQKDLEIILTVSPIRHIRDGLIENQRSKSTLLLATEKLCAELNYVHYFPSYELMMDDLRDYRYYTSDMIHPNETAIEYIWKNFQASFFEEHTTLLLKKIEPIIRANQHKPFHIHSVEHQTFLRQQLDKIKSLNKENTFLNFETERKNFEEQLQDR